MTVTDHNDLTQKKGELRTKTTKSRALYFVPKCNGNRGAQEKEWLKVDRAMKRRARQFRTHKRTLYLMDYTSGYVFMF